MMTRTLRLLFCFYLCALGGTAWSVPPTAAEELISVDKALQKIFRKASAFTPHTVTLSAEQISRLEEKADITFAGAHLETVTFYTAQENGQTVGYAFEDTVLGKWGPIHYLAGLNTDGQVKEVVILAYDEIRGRPVAKPRFLRQYKGKGLPAPVKLQRDIDGISGATISSRSLTDGIRKILYIFDDIKGE